MIITNELNPVEMSAPGKASSFTIERSPKLFKALSKNLYKDDVLAVVREISCNAYDAHVEAKKLNVPFVVNVPGVFSPYFEVKDFGKGLTELEIMGDTEKGISGLYTSYFKSSKNNTDEQIGGWGLGSKSPFAYTKQFNVESRQNGICKFYNCFENEQGEPSVIKMGESITNEPDGLTVKIPVRREDYNRFAVAVKNVFSFWESKPIFTGNGVIFNTYDYEIKEKDFAIVKDENLGCLTLVVNNIRYSVDHGKIKLPKVFQGVYQYNTLSNRTIIFCNISDVNVTLSRDNLEYTTKTIDFINKSLEKIEDRLIEDFNKKIKDCKTLNEAFLVKNNHIYKVNSFIFNGVKYEEKILSDVFGKGFTVGCINLKKSKEQLDYYLQGASFFNWPIFKKDITKSYRARVLKYLTDNNIRQCYIYEGDELDSLVLKYLGKIDKVSSLPEVPREKRDSIRAKTFKYVGSSYKNTSFDEMEIDITQTKGLYITNIDKLKNIKNWGDVSTILNLVKCETKMDIFKFPANKKKVLESNGWVHVSDKIDELLKDIKVEDTQSYYTQAVNRTPSKYIVDCILKDINKFEGKLKDFLEEYKEISKKKSKISPELEKLFLIFNKTDQYQFKNSFNIESEYYSIGRFQYDRVRITDFILMVDNWRKSGKMW